MKKVAGVFAFLPTLAFAGSGVLGTKQDVVSTSPGAPVGVMAVVQMVVALVIVIALVRVVLPKVLNKVSGRPATDMGNLQVQATANLGNGTLHIVQAGTKTLLIGATANGITCLSDLTDSVPEPFIPKEEVPSPVAAPTKPQTRSFEQLLATATTAGPGNDVAQALARLRALEE